MAAEILTRNIEPNIFMRIWDKYSAEITICAAVIATGLIVWFFVWLMQKLRPNETYGPYSYNGWGGAPVTCNTPTDVNYTGQFSTTYTVKHPADSVIYKDLKEYRPQFIVPAGGPQLIHAGETYKYTTLSDISVSRLSAANILQQFVMPTGSQIELQASDNLVIFCIWTGGDQTLKFFANNVA